MEESALEMLIEFLTSFPVQVVVGVAAATTTMMNPSMSMTMASGVPPGNASIPSGGGEGTVKFLPRVANPQVVGIMNFHES